ncbi:hypothetical protein ABZ079_06390 [Streptomyces sp. NPDC006314]|uniref:hypothetical protein n=1 Tax=Streptomyces sp. NPDC006314 TaxID=3154475 RepID=UPI0033BC677B
MSSGPLRAAGARADPRPNASAQSELSAARQALLAGLVPAGERTGLLARLQSTLNGGLAVGAAVGGLALSAGTAAAYRGVLALDTVCFLGCGLLLLRLPAVAAVGTIGGGRRFAVPRDRPYALVALLNAVPLVVVSLLLGWGTPGWLLLGALMPVASYAMGPAARRAAGRRTPQEVREPVLAS